MAAEVDHLPMELTTEMPVYLKPKEYAHLAPESEPEDGRRCISVLGALHPCLPRILLLQALPHLRPHSHHGTAPAYKRKLEL